MNVGIHRVGCTCPYCCRTVVKATLDRGPEPKLRPTVERDINEILKNAETMDPVVKTFYGGLEVTQPPRRGGYCPHDKDKQTRYDDKWFCRQCGTWIIDGSKPATSFWQDFCPSRGGGLTHAHWNRCNEEHDTPSHAIDQCCHCGNYASKWSPKK